MPTLTQTNQAMAVTTPLGADTLLLVGFTGTEGLSDLFRFDLDVVAERGTDVPFDKLLGQPVAVRLEMPKGIRHFSGLCVGARQGGTDEHFTSYQLHVVPNFWLWTKRQQSRIFQHLSVHDILKVVLKGQTVKFDLKGTYLPRDYCVQYRESDYDFAHRLMAEEGMYFFFTHDKGGHTLMVADAPTGHPDLPESSTLIYKSIHDHVEDDEEVVRTWTKRQELTSGKVSLWDHHFELPHGHLDADKAIQGDVAVGGVTHKLQLPPSAALEIYDYPGAYAQRFSGTDPGGGDRPADVQNIYKDNARTVALRMQEEALGGILIDATSNCAQVVAGHKFTLAQSPGNELTRYARADGKYVVTTVTHTARVSSDYRSGNWGVSDYANDFQCIPYSLPYRTPRTTPKPVVPGSQTALVVGPPGEEIFTDKYSRVKVQFHWDRQGKHNADSSCWVRVATHWAGKQWGIIHIPRIGQEVVVDFLEGDPDRPIIVGSVYNAETMPPYKLPANKTQSGIKSRSSLGGGAANFNEIRFEDKKGGELVTIHAEKDQSISVEHDEAHLVGHDRKKTIDHDETTHVKHDRTETVDNNETITIGVNRTEKVGANEDITIGVNRTEKVGANETISIGANRIETVAIAETITIGAAQALTVGAARAVTVGAVQTITVGAAQIITVGGAEVENYGSTHSQTVASSQTVSVGADGTYSIAGGRGTTVGKDDNLNVAKKLAITAGDEISITTGDASIVMKKDGTITIKGKDITVEGSGEMVYKADKKITMKGQKILQN